MTPVKDSVPVQQHVPVQQSVPVVSSQSSAFNDAISQRINRDIASRDHHAKTRKTSYDDSNTGYLDTCKPSSFRRRLGRF